MLLRATDCVLHPALLPWYLILNPQDAILHHETGDSVDLVGSFNTAYSNTVPCVMVHCCTVWIVLNIAGTCNTMKQREAVRLGNTLPVSWSNVASCGLTFKWKG